MMTMTPRPRPTEPVLFCTAVSAIQVANVQVMPQPEMRKRGRRPQRSTSSAKMVASIQLVTPMMPFNLFWNCGSVIPTSLRILLEGCEWLFLQWEG